MARNRSLIIASMLTLSLTSLTVSQANAQGRYGYPDSYRGSTSVDRLADQIDDIAEGIYREYARNNRRPDRDERRALEALRELNVRADRFSRVMDDRRDMRHSDREYDLLVRSFFETQDSLDRISRRPYVDRGMFQIGQLLRQMDRRFDRYDDRDRGRGGRYDRDGRWDRYNDWDRYDRWDRGRRNGRH
ncbi:MAG TPA: hypothetical protein VEL74_05845 [Thermoanaerobaculia bacterium]|nr:hypothetical protein [Thermoanaerobaculia bacterium]